MHIGTKVTDPSGRYEAEVHINGVPQPLYRRQSDGKVFVAGIPGQAYTLLVRNLSTGRLEIVNSIDQRDTLSDRPASVDNPGMLVPRYGATTFDGWRHNDGQVGEFVFGEPSHSVAAQAGGSTSVGIIGFAAYAERYVDPYQGYQGAFLDGLEKGSPPATMGGDLKYSTPRGGLGTGIGQTIESHVTRVSFTRAPGAPAILEIGYDTEAWLRENGIIAPAEPSAFPPGQAFGAYQRMG